MGNFLRTLRDHRVAWKLLQGPLQRWFVPAAMLTLLLGAAGWYGISWLAERATAWLVDRSSWAKEEVWLQVGVEWSIWLALLVVKLKVTKYLVLVVMGPLFAAVSEAAEAHVTGTTVDFSWTRWWRESLRGMRSALVLLVVEWTLTLACWFVGLVVPITSPVMVPLAWAIGAWAYGASVMDYVWERDGKGAFAGLRATAARPGIALGVGIPFSLWMALPLLAWTVGPMMGGLGATVTAVQALRGHASSSSARGTRVPPETV